MDFNVHAVNRILAALENINNAIRLSTGFVERHSLYLGDGIVTECSSVSGLLGLLEVVKELIGSVTATTNVSGAIGIFLAPGAVAATPTVGGALSRDRRLIGLINAQVVIVGLLQGTSRLMAGEANGISNISGSLNQVYLAGSISSGATVNGYLSGTA